MLILKRTGDGGCLDGPEHSKEVRAIEPQPKRGIHHRTIAPDYFFLLTRHTGSNSNPGIAAAPTCIRSLEDPRAGAL
jgi:hypothetical protein